MFESMQSEPSSKRLPQTFIHHETARDFQLAQGARDEGLLRRMDVAPGGKREVAERAVDRFEGGKQPGQADRRMVAAVEGQQQELEMRKRAAGGGRGEA